MNAHVAFAAPIKLGDRQEQFCQRIVEGKSHAEAYRLAYGVGQTSSESAGPRLFGSVRVQARIAQIRAYNAAAERVTLPFLTAGLLEAYRLGMATGQASAASQAMLGVAKLHGFMIDRHQVDVAVRRPSPSPESPDEMLESDWVSKHGLLDLSPATDATSDMLTSDVSSEGSEPS